VYLLTEGHLSPLRGLCQEDIGLEKLASLVEEGLYKEIILETNPTVEGEATANYIAEIDKKHNVRATRIAHGVPLVGEFEYIDGGTLSRAFSGRSDV